VVFPVALAIDVSCLVTAHFLHEQQHQLSTTEDFQQEQLEIARVGPKGKAVGSN
jgi:hypothetical protein